jgi:hypothetical protein
MKKFLLSYLIVGFENNRMFTEAVGRNIEQAAASAEIQLRAYWSRFIPCPVIGVLHVDYSKDKAILAMLASQPRFRT